MNASHHSPMRDCGLFPETCAEVMRPNTGFYRIRALSQCEKTTDLRRNETALIDWGRQRT